MNLVLVLQIFVPVIILSVWLIRANKKTKFRGGNTNTLKEEFMFYGLSSSTFYIIGSIKIALSIILFSSIWNEILLLYASLGLATLMLAATLFHLKSRDSLKKTSPSFILFILNLFMALN